MLKITVCIGSSCHIKGSRQVVEQLNESASDLDETQLSAIAAMIANNPTMQSWQIEKIYKKP